MHKFLSTLLVLLLAPASVFASGPRQECESWARSDGIDQMKWDAYVESCVQSMTGEGEPEPAPPDPTPAPAQDAYEKAPYGGK